MELLLRNRASVNLAEFFHAPCRKNYTLDRKMNDNFLMASTISITVQNFVKIVPPAVGAKMWCLSLLVRTTVFGFQLSLDFFGELENYTFLKTR